jgi:predicted Fe-Mo cluster-binding NifX family protein
MKLAIPEFNGRVSPTFDFCRHLLLVEISPGEPSLMTTFDLSGLENSRRARFLKKLEIDTLLCGGISRKLTEDIEGVGIRIIPWLSGEIQEVLQAYLNGKLPDPQLTLPGCNKGKNSIRFQDRNKSGQKE